MSSVRDVDLKLEAVVIPVSDVDRAKEFYGASGGGSTPTSLDNGFRVVQFTPPGSGCSVQFGTNITSAAPGSAQGLYLVVSDIEAARDELVAARRRRQRGVPPRRRTPVPATSGPRSRRERQLQLLRHVPRPGRQRLAAAGDHDAAARAHRRRRDGVRLRRDLASALRRAEAAHGEHEKRTGEDDADWPDWYAAYMVAEQAGTELPT